jgi:hypothetical protein
LPFVEKKSWPEFSCVLLSYLFLFVVKIQRILCHRFRHTHSPQLTIRTSPDGFCGPHKTDLQLIYVIVSCVHAINACVRY